MSTNTKQPPNSFLVFASGFAAAFATVWTLDWVLYMSAKHNAVQAIAAAREAAQRAAIEANGEVVSKRSEKAIDLESHSGTVH